MTEEEYKKLTIEDKVALANNKETPRDLIKKIIEEDDMQLKMQLMMSNKAITDFIEKSKQQ
jgi:hypothetical protein